MRIGGNGGVIEGATIELQKCDRFTYITLIRCNIDDVENRPFENPVFENCQFIDCQWRSKYESTNQP